MRQDVLSRIAANADYHAAMAEHFAALKENKNGNGRERATLDDTHEIASPGDDVLTRLVEMHAGAAEQLRELIASEKPENILEERANRTVVRKAGLPMRNGSARIH